MKKIIIVLSLISLLFLAACAQQSQTVVESQPADTQEKPNVEVVSPSLEPEDEIPEEEPTPPPEAPEPTAEPEASTTNTIEMTDAGWSPKTLTISSGDTVTFVNKVSRKVWPASDIHPTHTTYPGSSIQKCGSDDTIFDACSALEEGESYSFTFDETGSWGFHDHRAAGFKGTITVE